MTARRVRVCHCATCGDRIGRRDIADPWATAWCSYCGTTVMLLARKGRGGPLVPTYLLTPGGER